MYESFTKYVSLSTSMQYSRTKGTHEMYTCYFMNTSRNIIFHSTSLVALMKRCVPEEGSFLRVGGRRGGSLGHGSEYSNE